DRGHLVSGNFSGDALIHRGGVEKAIGNNDASGGQSGENGFPDHLGPTGGEKEQLGLGSHGVTLWSMLEQMADVFADRGAARFPDEHRGLTALAEIFEEPTDLRTFTATLGTLETDEKTIWNHAGHAGGKMRK